MAPTKDTADVQWCEFDFEANKHLWKNRGFDKAEPVRQRNLAELTRVLEEAGVFFWLQGRTLLGLHTHGALLDDHDDDVGVFAKDRQLLETRAFPRLQELGFAMIRNNADTISLIRDERYIDICLFEVKGNKIGYGNKWFPRRHFSSFESIEYQGETYPVPSHTGRLLKQMYAPSLIARSASHLARLVQPASYLALYKKIVRWATWRMPHGARKHLNLVLMTAGMKYVQVSEQEFREILIEPADSFNWRWRKPHLDLITQQGKYRRVGEIVQYLASGEGVDKLVPEIRETDMSTPFHDPANYDQRFWHSGNNFFAYCILYQFKDDVVPYAQANEYIKAGRQPRLYTADYYESRRSLSAEEIEQLLKEDAIELTEGSITSGKHRACAMIGRMASGQPYIPFWAIKVNGE